MEEARATPVDPSVRKRAIAAGRAEFGRDWRPSRVATAPGRIELLGNHLDYNGGPVLAAAIDRAVSVFASDDPGGLRGLVADIADAGVAEFDQNSLVDWRNDGEPGPYDYVKGVIAAIQSRDDLSLRNDGAFTIAGDVPIGFGLSSSAALCVSLTLALSQRRPGDRELVLTAQEAEHRAGTPCGTMDQSASVAGGVICFDGATLRVEKLVPNLDEYVFAVADSGVERSLGSSAYADRVDESRQALEKISTFLGIQPRHLSDVTQSQLEEASRGTRPLDPVLLRRARHVVSETDRVRRGKVAVQQNDWQLFGRLMTESGRSSATDYQISHPRVEELVAEAGRRSGVLGARMMGGGEGGTALILLGRDQVDSLELVLRSGYYARYGMADRDDLIHVCAFSEGASVETLVR